MLELGFERVIAGRPILEFALRAGVAWLDLNDIGAVLAWVGTWAGANPQVPVAGVVKD